VDVSNRRFGRALKEMVHQYETLKSFSKCRFDFVSLGRSVSRLHLLAFGEPLDIEPIRYKFDALEQHVLALKSSDRLQTRGDRSTDD